MVVVVVVVVVVGCYWLLMVDGYWLLVGTCLLFTGPQGQRRANVFFSKEHIFFRVSTHDFGFGSCSSVQRCLHFSTTSKQMALAHVSHLSLYLQAVESED